MIREITIELKSGRGFVLSVEDARELYHSLNNLFNIYPPPYYVPNMEPYVFPTITWDDSGTLPPPYRYTING